MGKAVGRQQGEMSRRISKDQVGGLRVELRAQRIGRSRMVESRT